RRRSPDPYRRMPAQRRCTSPPWKRQPKKRAKRRIAAMDEAQGEEAAEGEAVDVPAAEHEDAPTAEGAGLPDEPIEAAEVESPPIVPVDLDEGRPPLDIDAADFAGRSIGPGADVESVPPRRFRLDLGSRPR